MAIINRVSSLPVFFLLFSCSLLHICTSNDTMRIGQSFRDGQTLISQHQQFALGFFSPGTSKKRYLGIWYNKIPIQTVIWVANRENPLSDSSGILSFGDDGNLRILDGRNNTLWFTDTPVVDFKPTLRLLDSGNLILAQTDVDDVFYNSSLTLWQSFDYPSDTGLPGTRLGVNGDSGLNTSLTSWKDSNDPSYGDFTIGVDPYGSFQIFIWEKKRNTKYWRSGHWDWQVYIPLVQMINVYFNGFNLMGDTLFKYSTSNFYMRFVMNSTGTVQLYGWIEESKEWRSYMSQPSDQCQVYGWCGSNGQCNRSSSCECLPGFEPRDVREWGMEDWSSGCFRSRGLQCHVNASRSVNDGNGDGFWRLRGMKLPDGSFMLGEVVDVGLCEGRCVKNCSCVAYAFVNGVGCLVWDGDLMDTVKFPSGGQDLYIRLASSELQRLKSNDRGRILLLAMILGACVIGQVLFCACACGYWRWKLRQKDINSSREVARYFSEENNLGEDRIDGGPNLHLFDLETVAVATENFSSSNKLGSGGFGPVYKGKLPGGQRIAVKRLSRNSGQGVVEFKNEVIMISKLQHRNLVKLIGCCIQSEEKMLLYEFMPNKSLDAFIFDPHKRAQLDWRKRLHIIEGIARGLLYLHRDSRLRIIHRDLKASNILLDSEMNPKISDFGMARIFGGNQTEANTNRVMGTYGYMSPEYAMEGLFSEKSDVFSFGVLLLEIISGRKNTSFCNLEQHSSNLVRSAWHLWNEDKETQLMDPFLTDSCSMHEVLRCIHVGLLCVQDAATERPTMRQVLSMLGSEISINLPTPKQVAFSMDRSLTETNSSIRSQDMFSTNEITITSIEGR